MPRSAMCLALALVATCSGQGPTGDLPLGTWGGENAAAIVGDSMHVHIACTNGNAPRPSLTAGRFEVAGQYNITAHPVDLGVFHPAIFAGGVTGNEMTLTITLTDTSVMLGPATMRLGREPRMGPCPICRIPPRLALRIAALFQ